MSSDPFPFYVIRTEPDITDKLRGTISLLRIILEGNKKVVAFFTPRENVDRWLQDNPVPSSFGNLALLEMKDKEEMTNFLKDLLDYGDTHVAIYPGVAGFQTREINELLERLG